MVIMGLLASLVGPAMFSKLSDLRTSTGPDWDGPYMRELPPDPWGNPYLYQYPDEEGYYRLSTYGRDAKPGGEDEDQDVTN